MCNYDDNPKERSMGNGQFKALICVNVNANVNANVNLNGFSYFQEILFKDFPAQQQYNIFNESFNSCYHRTYCDDLNIPDRDKKRELINLCKRIACKYINLPNIVRSERNYYDRCSYFINWAQDVIKKHFKVDLASNYYYHFIFKLIDVARYISWEDLKSPPCQRLFDSDFRHWEVEKDIHDYFKNIDTLKSKIDTEADKRNSYLEYLTYIKDLYEKNYVECCDPYDVSYSNCPNYFICNPNFHPSELIAKIKPDTHVKRVIVGGQRGNPQLLSTVQALSATWTYNQNVRNASRGGDSSSLFFSSLFTGLNGAKRASKLQGKSYRYGVGGQDAYCPSGTTYDYRMHTCKTREGLSFRVVNYGKDYDPATLDNQIEYLDDIGILVPGSKGESPSKYSSFRLGLSCALGLIIIIVLYLFIKRTPFGYDLRHKKKRKKTAEEAMIEIHVKEELDENNGNAGAQWDGYNGVAQWDGYNGVAQWDGYNGVAQWDGYNGEGQWDYHNREGHYDEYNGEGQYDGYNGEGQYNEHNAEGKWDEHSEDESWDGDNRGGESFDYSNTYDDDRPMRFSYQPSYEAYD